jgi:nitrate/nitrite transporter NarK
VRLRRRNFSSSMSNISFFYPKQKQGLALGLNAGLGNLGVSVAQAVIPLVITVGVFGALGGAPQPRWRAGHRCSCRTPASSGCRPSRCAPSRPGSA